MFEQVANLPPRIVQTKYIGIAGGVMSARKLALRPVSLVQ
jgi:hypothetical protein